MPVALPAAIIGSSVIGGIANSSAASSAADAQRAAAQQATDAQMAMFNRTQQNLAPFVQQGGNAYNYLNWLLGIPGGPSGTPGTPAVPGTPAQPATAQPAGPTSYGSSDGTIYTVPAPWQAGANQISAQQGAAGGVSVAGTPGTPGTPAIPGTPFAPSAFGSLTRAFAPTMDQLASTPGYQFTRDQGLKATQNAYAAQGLGSSGAALKGATDYAEGLAGTTFQQQLQNYLAQNAQIYNMLYGPAALGESAAAQQGAIGAQTAGQVGQNIIGAGNASAAASIAGGNAISSIAGSVPSAIMAYNNPYLTGAFATNSAPQASSLGYGMFPNSNGFMGFG